MPAISPHPAPRAARILAVIALLAGASACGTTARNPFARANPAETRISVFVENRGFNDFRLYALTARGTESLGSVGGNTNRRVNIAWRQLDQISFRIEVLAGRTYNTQGVAVSPGDRIQLVVPDDPGNAYIQVR